MLYFVKLSQAFGVEKRFKQVYLLTLILGQCANTRLLLAMNMLNRSLHI